MSIVCGTDFSEHSEQALDAAARLAARMDMPLHVVHAIDLGSAALVRSTVQEATAWAESRLHDAARRLAGAGCEVSVHAELGVPDEVLIDVGTREHAKLMIVAALGQRDAGKWQLGSHADRAAQRSNIPVLVVRDAEPFAAWVAERRPLRIALGVDLSLSSEIAMRWVNALCAFGPCDVSAIHLYWPPEQFRRLGLSGVRDYFGPHPEVLQALDEQLRTRLSRVFGPRPIRLRIEPHIGRIADRFAKLAEADGANLLVIGSHERDAIDRAMTGSVSRGVLHCAHVSVACVPAPARAPASRALLANVLVATDFSETGNAAIPLAYSIVAPGGRVHLIHVVEAEGQGPTDPHDIFESDRQGDATGAHADLRRRLFELIPNGLAGEIASQAHVLESNRVADAIFQAAERLDSDAICLGTHGRRGVTKALLGSVAEAVIRETRRPVLLSGKPNP